MSKYDYAIFIGRLQPPHKEHINQILKGLELADKIIIALGSHRAAANIKNPWTAVERELMVRSCFNEEQNLRLEFTQVRDYYYNNTTWFTDLMNSVHAHILIDHPKICLIGCNKDESSWYLEALPEQWKRELSYPHTTLNATDVRNLYFQAESNYAKDIHPGVHKFLRDWSKTELYAKLTDEWKYIKDYKHMWAQAPYPVTFSTTDVAVIKNGHILLVKRKFNPGKGLLALPGGFINQNESIMDSAFRELKEETRVLVPRDVLQRNIVDQRVFDHPDRSLRGRTITHAFCVKLPDGPQLPQVKGDDDAERAMWVSLSDLYVRENEFYEDHLHMIEYFIRKL